MSGSGFTNPDFLYTQGKGKMWKWGREMKEKERKTGITVGNLLL